MRKIAVLGSTGSIGTQTLEVVRENDDIQVTALAAGEQCRASGTAGQRIPAPAGEPAG